MMEYIDISILNPAEYNPRLLTNEAQEDLKKSIKELGIIKPIIIRQSDKRIMAGHQRSGFGLYDSKSGRGNDLVLYTGYNRCYQES